MRNLLLSLSFLFFAAPLAACSCAYVDNFCAYLDGYVAWDTTNTKVVVVKATLVERRSPVRGFPLYDFQIDQVLGGTYTDTHVSLLGQDGANCNGPRDRLAIGTQLVLFFHKSDYWSAHGHEDVPNRYPIYDFPGCGEAYLFVTGNQVSGKITPGVTSMSLDELFDELTDCGLSELPPGIAGPVDQGEREFGADLPQYEATVFPNPAVSTVFVELTTTEGKIEKVDLHDLTGRRIHTVLPTEHPNLTSGRSGAVIDVRGLAPGVYFLVVNTDGLRVKKKIVVQR